MSVHHPGVGRLTDFGPTVLIPAAWTVTLAAHRAVVARRTLLIALCVMDVLLVAFYLAGRAEMTGPVLGIWRRVLLAGFVATLAGTVDLAVGADSDPVALLTLYAWMVLPGAAYVATARAVETDPYRRVYLAGGTLSLVGAATYALAAVVGPWGVVAGLATVGVGQTAGIVAAAVQNAG